MYPSTLRHEHLYTEVVHKLIRSDELPSNAKEMRKVIGSSRIMLCTLSMLSNPALRQNGTFEVIPMERLIIDEASQINVFEFMIGFNEFQRLSPHHSFILSTYLNDSKRP